MSGSKKQDNSLRFGVLFLSLLRTGLQTGHTPPGLTHETPASKGRVGLDHYREKSQLGRGEG